MKIETRFKLSSWGLRLALVPFGSVTVTGQENLPQEGAYLIVTNHMSVADSPLLLLALPPQQYHFFAGEKWADLTFFGWWIKWLGAVFIDRTIVDRQALRVALGHLEAGVPFGLAPEGTRSKEGPMNEAKDGAAYLAVKAGVPIVPVGFVNTDVIFKNMKRLKRTKMEVRIGKPFMLPDLGRRPRGGDMSAYTRYIMANIAALLPPRYHGFYRGDPAVQAIMAGEDGWEHCIAQEVGTD
ncbi:MAG TPA: lysophospholipid acyltransferase family protein [Anaerolineae bacterium]|nr:lysophospholipid acyltransferase family protein [Anaerolineae bacterium]